MKPESRPAGEDPGAEYVRELWRLTTFAFAVQLGLAAFYLVAAGSLETPVPLAALFSFLGIGFVLLLLPDLLVYRDARVAGRGPGLCVALRTAMLLLALVALGFLLTQLGPPGLVHRVVGALVALLGLLLAGMHLVLHARHGRRPGAVLAAALGGAFSAYLGFVTWGHAYHTPMFAEVLLSGNTHIDTLFHAAVANLLQTHLVPTIGLDGIVPLSYHAGSHFVLGSLASLGPVTIFEFYNVFYAIVFVPLLLKALLLAGLDLARSQGYRWDSLGAAAVLVLILATLPWPWNLNPFIAESTLLAMTSALLALSTISRHPRRPWLYFALFALTIFTLFAKISVGAPLLLCLGYLFFRWREHRVPSKAAQFVGLFALAALLTWLFFLPGGQPVSTEEGSLLAVLEHVFRYAPPVPLLYLSWLALTIVLFTRSGGNRRSLRVWWESLSLVALATLAISVLKWRTPSAVIDFLIAYFLLSIPILLSLGHFILRRPRARKGLTVALSILVPLTLLAESDVALDYHETRRQMRASAEVVRNDPAWPARVELVAALAELDRLPRSEKRRSVVFVPKSNAAYWGLFWLPGRSQFLVQAATGIAMIGGQEGALFVDQVDPYPRYGLRAYRREVFVESLEEAATAARRLGFETLFVVDSPAGGIEVTRRRLAPPGS